MLIRDREDSDLPRLTEILRATHLSDAYPFRPENASVAWLTRHPGPAWVLVVDGVVVGHVALDAGSADAGAEVARFVVAPEARGTGGASMLLQHALAHAGTQDPWLVVMPHNAAAVALYERSGFVRDGDDGWTDVDGGWHPVIRYRYAGRSSA